MKKIFEHISRFGGELCQLDEGYPRYSIDELCHPSIDAALLIRNGEAEGLPGLLMTLVELIPPKDNELRLPIAGSCLAVQLKEREMGSLS